MVLFLIEYFNINNSIFNVVNYITIRSGLSLMTSLFFILIFGPYLIKLIAKFQLEGQPIRLDGPESHLIAKKGTPTMGGFIILLSIIISILLWSNFSSQILWPCLFIMISFGIIGFFDDYKKVSNNTSDGVSGKTKIILEILCAVIFVIWSSALNLDNQKLLSLPFLKDIYINLGFFFIPFVVFVIIGSANAVNLTDGLDGLAIVPIMIVALTFALICYLAGNIIFSNYLYINYVPGAGELTILCGALIGSRTWFFMVQCPSSNGFYG